MVIQAERKIKPKYHYMLDLTKEIVPKKKGTPERYIQIIEGLWDYIFEDYTRKDYLAKVKYSNTNAKEMTIIELLGHMIIWRPNIVFGFHISVNDFYELNPLTNDAMADIMERISKKFVLAGVDSEKLSITVSMIIESFAQLSENYSGIACNTFSLYDVMQFEDRSAVFRNLINTKIDDTQPVKEIERFLKRAEALMIESVRQDRETAFYPFIQSGRLNKLQTTQMLVGVGPRPDIDKTILPRIVKGSYLKGFDDAGEYYVEAVNARVALLIKHINLRESGYLSRKVNILCLNTELDHSVQDCKTPNTLEYEVVSKDHLRMIMGKYQVLPNGKLKELTGKEEELIGQTIQLRSHICCAHSETGKVCRTCYGSKYKTLGGTRIGGLPAVKLMNPLSQMGLSAKHQSTTKSTEITNENIKKFLRIENNFAYVKQEYLRMPDTFIVLDKESVDDIMMVEVDCDDETLDLTTPLDNIRFRIGEEEFAIENNDLQFNLSEDVISSAKTYMTLDEETDTYIIPTKKLDTITPIFVLVLHTEEVSRYLAMIKSKIESSLTKTFSYNKLVKEVVEVIIDAGLKVSINHLETIVYNMVRDKDNVTRRPQFNVLNPQHVCLSITQSILKKDMHTSLSYQNLKDQFKDVSSFKKTGKSVFDPFFRVSAYEY